MIKQIRAYIFFCSMLCGFSLFGADIIITFCPVTKNYNSKQFTATMTVQNNSGVELDLSQNPMTFDWPSLVSLPAPFTNGVQNGITWTVNIDGIGNTIWWPEPVRTVFPAGGTATKDILAAQFAGILQFPTSGTFVQGGSTYTVEFNNCNTTQNYELYDKKFDFDRNCFIYSPEQICLGEAATEIWLGEGIFDAMIPNDRPSWAIAVMVAHRLFTNLVGQEILSPNFWTATAMNESRMTCDATIVPDQRNHCKINNLANSGCTGTDTRTTNCFQVLNLGYVQISNFQPDLFSQSNAYGTANYANIVDGGNWETGALAVTYYHYQDIRYWDQIYCFNIPKTWKDSKDPYAIEKIFYHAYHDGPDAGVSLLNDILANYSAATAATNMNDVIGTGGTWSSPSAGSSQKVGNFTSLLDGGNGNLYPGVSKTDPTTEYYGCYNDLVSWSDVLYYLDEIKILYPQVKDAPVENAIKAVFDNINGGGAINFQSFGRVIDEIVIQLGGHDPSSYIADQRSASKTCPKNALGISLRSNDTLCPGEDGYLQVWMSGDPNFAFDLSYPDGSTQSFSNISNSPYNVSINLPGKYEITYFEDDDEIADLNCLFSSMTLPTRGDIYWDKSSVSNGCASGDLKIVLSGDGPWNVVFTKDGLAQTPVAIPSGSLSPYTIANNPGSGKFILSGGGCGNDTITFCGCATLTVSADTAKAICQGESVTLYGTCATATGWVWSQGATTQNVTATPTMTSTYTVTATDAGGCTGTDRVIITVNNRPTASAGPPVSVCTGTPDTLTATGGNSYLWNTGSTVATAIVSPVNTTTFTVTVTDSNGCKDTAEVVVTADPLPVVNAGTDDAVCAGATANLSATNATNFMWSNGASTASTTVTPIVKTTYTVTGTHLNGCTNDDQVVIDIIDFNPSVKDTSLCDGDSVAVKAFGGTSYLWSTSGTYDTILVNPAVTTTYTVTIDNSGCKDTLEALVTVLKSPVTTNDDEICAGDTAQVSAVGGGSYLWSNNATTAVISITPVTDTDYYVTITLNGCQATGSASVVVNGNPTATATSNTTTICPGANATLNATGGSAYLWSSSSSSQNIIVSPKLNTTYTVTVANIEGCTAQDTAVVKVFPGSTPDAGSNDSICAGASILLQASGGGTYLWQSGATTDTLRVSPATSTYYTVTVSNNGCLASDSVFIKVNALPNVSVGDQTICINDTTVLTATGGDGYIWNTFETSSTLQVSPAVSGNYTVTAINTSGCTASDFSQVTVHTLPAPDAGTDKPLCKDKSTALAPTLNAGWTYRWQAEAGGVISNNAIATPTVSYTSPGTLAADTNITFYLEVTNSNNCIGIDSVTVTFEKECRSTVSVSASSTTICLGDSVIISAAIDTIKSIVSLTWNDVSMTNDNLGPFSVAPAISVTYEAIIVDVDGGRDTSSVSIQVNPIPTANAGQDTSICEKTAVALMASGGLSYSWSNGVSVSSNPVMPVVNTTYTVTVTNAFNCTHADAVTVSLRSLPPADAGANQKICPGDTVVLTATGGTTYKWHTGATTAAIKAVPQIATIYNVTVTDLFGCSESDLVAVDLHAAVMADAGEDGALCKGKSISVTASGGDLFSWSTGETTTTVTLTPAATAVYSVTITEATTSCSDKDTVVMTVNPLPTANTGNNRSICIGTLVSLAESNTGMKSYLWSNAFSGRINPVAPAVTTTYAITITDYNDCSDDTSVVITVHPLPVVTFDSTYTVCVNTPAFGLAGGSPSGGLYAGPGVSAGNFNPAVIGAGTHSIQYTFTDTNTCVSSASSSAIVMDIPARLLSDTGICRGDVAVLHAGDPSRSYLWDDGSVSANRQVSPTYDSTYTVLVSVAGGCFVVDSAIVTVSPLPTVSVGADSAIGCAPFQAMFSNSTTPAPQFTYWYFGESSDSGTVSLGNVAQQHLFNQEGLYSVTAWSITDKGCSSGATFQHLIKVLPKPVAAFTFAPKSPTTLYPSVHFESLSNAGIKSWLWDFSDPGSTGNATGTPSPDHEFSGPGYYPVTLSINDSSGCSDEFTLTVYVKADHILYIPNAFSPNQDGLNDIYQVYGTGIEETNFNLYIYTRWGEQIFHGTSILAGWDGRKDNKAVPTGVYQYVILYQDLEGKSFKKKGMLNVLY